MAYRHYFSACVGDGSIDDPFRAKIRDLVTVGTIRNVDTRGDVHSSSGEWFVTVIDGDAGEHATLVADADVEYLPIETAGNEPLSLEATIGDMPAGKRASTKTLLEDRHIPFSDFQATTTIRTSLESVVERLLLRQILKANDFSEPLGSLVSAMDAGKRAAINSALVDRGFDTGGIVGSMTIAEAIRYVVNQDNSSLHTYFGDL